MWDLLTEGIWESIIDLRLIVQSTWLKCKMSLSEVNLMKSGLGLFASQCIGVQLAVAVTVCVVASGFVFYMYLKWTFRRCKSNRRLDGKTALVTGANSGKNSSFGPFSKGLSNLVLVHRNRP